MKMIILSRRLCVLFHHRILFGWEHVGIAAGYPRYEDEIPSIEEVHHFKDN